MTGTMGVAHSEYWTGSMVPAFSSLSRSCSIFSLTAHGTGLALWEMGVAVGSTWILAFVPCKVPRPLQLAVHVSAKSLRVACHVK